MLDKLGKYDATIRPIVKTLSLEDWQRGPADEVTE